MMNPVYHNVEEIEGQNIFEGIDHHQCFSSIAWDAVYNMRNGDVRTVNSAKQNYSYDGQ